MSPLLSDLTTRFSTLSDTPSLDASVLLAHILDRPRSWIVAHPDPALTEAQQERLEEALDRIERGNPLPYILGRWEFFGMEFEINPHVLIPRPETELLVERAIAWLKESPARRTAADIGTGSGVVAVSIATHVPDVIVLATDISPEALEVARRNAQKFGVEDLVDFVQCDLLPARQGIFSNDQRLDLICANLPYIPTETLHRLPVYGREPTLALDGGADGLDLIRNLMRIAPDWLAANSLILFEIEARQGLEASILAGDMFPKAEIHVHPDLGGHDRLLEVALQT